MADPRKPSVAAPAGSDESGTFPEQDALFNNLVTRSVTVAPSSPYTPSAAAGAISAVVLDKGGFAYNLMNPAYGVKGDGTNEAAAINTALGLIPAGSTVYWPAPPVNYGLGASVTGTKANMTHQGAGRFTTIVKRLNTTNQKMFALESLAGITVQDMGFDGNGTNQSSNQEILRFDGTSSNELVQRVNLVNVVTGGMFIFGGPTARSLNPRFRDSDVTPIAAAANDLVTMVAEGGSTLGIRINSGHTAFCINIYEANNHPCIGCTETLSGNGAAGIAFSSCHRCPGIGNTITCGANDTGITILKETDNANARPQLDQALSGNTMLGVSASSIAYKVTNASNTHISGGSLDSFSIGVNYNGGTGLVGVTVGDVEFINVVNTWLGTVPAFTWWHDNRGVNPLGKLTAPAVPATGIDAINNTQVNAIFYVTVNATTLSVGFQPPPILLLTTSSTGGTLVPGTYAYRVSLVDNGGGESLAGTEVTIVVPAGTSTNTVTILWFQPSGPGGGSPATYRVYGRTTGAELRMATAQNTNTFTDDGSITPSGALPATNGTQRATGLASGSIFVPANQTIAWSGGSAPTWTAWDAG